MTLKQDNSATLPSTPDELMHKLHYFHAYFRSLGYAFYILLPIMDKMGAPTDYQILYMNPVGERETGVTLDAVRGKLLSQVMPQRGFALACKYFDEVVISQTPKTHEIFVPPGRSPMAGGWYYLDLLPAAGGLTVAVRNITQEKVMAQRVQSIQQQLVLMADHSADIVIMMDAQNRHLFVNRTFRDNFGYTLEELNAIPLTDRVHPDDVSKVANGRLRPADGDDTRYSEFRYRTKSGQYLWLDANTTIFPDEEGNPTLALCVARDITARKLAEAQEAERQRRVEGLRQVSERLHSTLDVEKVLDIAFAWIIQFSQSDAANILLVDADRLSIVRHQGYSPDSLKPWVAPAWTPVTELPWFGEPIRTGKTLIAHDVFRADQRDVPAMASVHSHLTIPIRSGGKVLGLVNLDYFQPTQFENMLVSHLDAFAAIVALALQNALIHQQSHEIATAHERQRLAHELHDSVMQTLFSASIIAQALQGMDDLNTTRARGTLNELNRLISGSLAEMRSLLVELRPLGVENTDLTELLQQLAMAYASRSNATITFEAGGQGKLPPNVQRVLYRIAQESFSNISRHAHATKVTISFQCDGQTALLKIADNGRGFDPKHVVGEHFGLQIMHERASNIGATLTISGAPGHGTIIQVAWSAPFHDNTE